jgi:16S rRNA (adenine1518-N6/adenine1519-N6)-dimethyltransferase
MDEYIKRIKKSNIRLDPLKDQFLLLDDEIIQKIVSFAKLDKRDIVLEIGTAMGILTKEVAKKAGKVITFEIDKKFKPFLSKLPKNVDVRYESAWEYVKLHGKFKKKKEYNKVVSNPPYSFIEPLLHNLTFLEYDKVILVVPLRFLKKGPKWAILDSFFKVKTLLKIPKEKFYPIPKTDSVVIDLIKLPDPIKTKNLELFLRQYVYQHEGQLVKNSLMEGIVKYAQIVYSKKITKNEAREIIAKSKIDPNFLNAHPDNPLIYELIKQIKI